MATAAGFGYYVYPPLDFTLLLDGDVVLYRLAGSRKWCLLEKVGFPKLRKRFNKFAPKEYRDWDLQFLSTLQEPGMVQIGTGLLIRTDPGWSTMIRSPANTPRPHGYEQFEAFVETDWFFTSLFVNIRITRTGLPIHFRPDVPLLQVSAIPRSILSDEVQRVTITTLPDWSLDDWAAYGRCVVQPDRNPSGPPGGYAIEARKRARLAP